jgi:hypothetical protein
MLSPNFLASFVAVVVAKLGLSCTSQGQASGIDITFRWMIIAALDFWQNQYLKAP